jgi:hypothetical protein
MPTNTFTEVNGVHAQPLPLQQILSEGLCDSGAMVELRPLKVVTAQYHLQVSRYIANCPYIIGYLSYRQ